MQTVSKGQGSVMSDQVSRRLQEVEILRSRLTAQITNSEDVLASIESKIEELKERQEMRMKADDRISDQVVQNIARSTGITQEGDVLIQNAEASHRAPRRQNVLKGATISGAHLPP